MTVSFLALPAVLVLAIIVVLAVVHRRGGKQLAEPHPKHIGLLEEFRKDELALAYNLTLTRLLMSREFKSSQKRLKAEVEVARSLYVELMRHRKTPITVSDKAKLKIALTKLAVFDLQKRRALGDYSDLSLRVDQEVEDPLDQKAIDERLLKMLTAIE